MRLSVIIPALNEEALIGQAVDRVRAGDPWEVIVVDGHSADGTAAVARRHGARVTQTRPGRGRQLNHGASVATGDVLLFLHADTVLPEGFTGHVRRALAKRDARAGAFRLRIGAPHVALRVVEKAVNWRSRVLGLPFGDQAIFLEARTFRLVGGFPTVEAMEDFELMRRLRGRGRIALADAEVTTSARRWLRHGVWRTTLVNHWCIAAYLLGVPESRIAAWRRSMGPRRHRQGTRPEAVPQVR